MHRVETRTGRSYMEIGVLPAPHHYLRINTIKNCVIASTTLLEHNANPDDDKVNPRHPLWRLIIDNPVGGGVSAESYRGFDREFDRGAEEDFRWIVDLESPDMFGTLESKIDTDCLLPIMIIPNGIFYTRLKSPPLNIRRNGESSPFGCIASVTGCDIPILGGRVRLIEQGTGELIFDFEPAEHTIYEVVNTPPDIEIHEPEDPCHEHPEKKANEHRDEPDPCDFDHFKNYYRLFKEPDAQDQICFFKADAAPAPDPFLCGVVSLGRRAAPLRE